MAIHFPMHPHRAQDRRFARSSEFRVTSIPALREALSHYPNIVVHDVYEGRGGNVRLTTADGTWYTGFVNGEEASIVDEILLPLLMEREVVHLYQILVTDTGLDSACFSLCANGQHAYSLHAHSEAAVTEQLLTPAFI